MNQTELKSWLVENGFIIFRQNAGRFNECNWYACRKVTTTRACECNEDKGVQIVVYPHVFEGRTSVEVDLTGERTIWFKLRAYGMDFDEFIANLPMIEKSLVAAWEALQETR